MRRLRRELRPVHDGKGVRIPQALLEHIGLEGKIEIIVTDGRIEIRAAGHGSAKKPAANGRS